jgi:hypothetical protein
MIHNSKNTEASIPTLAVADVVTQPILPMCDSVDLPGDSVLNFSAEQGYTITKLPTDTGADGGRVLRTLKAAGVKFIGLIKSDPLFHAVGLPAGWKLVVSEQRRMHLDLLDHNGRKRAGIFCQEKCFERRARMRLTTRYNVQRDYTSESVNDEAIAYVLDGPKVIHTIGPVPLQTHPLKRHEAGLQAEKAAMRWLDERFPLWRDATQYWD